jgi:hypothetical protein
MKKLKMISNHCKVWARLLVRCFGLWTVNDVSGKCLLLLLCDPTFFCVNKMKFSVSVYNLHCHPCHRPFLASYLVMSNQLKSVFLQVIVKASSGPRYVVGCRSKVDKEKLIAGTRVVLDMTTLTIMRTLPREVYGCYRLFLYVFTRLSLQFTYAVRRTYFQA